MIHEQTPEQIARHYSAALDSVSLLDAGKPERMDDKDWEGVKARNVAHLRIILEKDFWTTEDLDPLREAVLRWGDGS